MLSLVVYWYTYLEEIAEKNFGDNSVFGKRMKEIQKVYEDKLELYKKDIDGKIKKISKMVGNTAIILDEEGIEELREDLKDVEYLKTLLSIIEGIAENNDIKIFRRGDLKFFGLCNNETQFVRISERSISIKGLSEIEVKPGDRNGDKVTNRKNKDFLDYLGKNGLEYFKDKLHLSFDNTSEKTVKNYNRIEKINGLKLDKLVDEQNFEKNFIKLIERLNK